MQQDLIIRTVTGDIAPKDLGFCNCHTHTLVKAKHMESIVAEMITDDYDVVLAELESFKNAGGKTIVDCSVVGEGRATEDLVTLSTKSGVNIIGATGFHMPAFYPQGHWSLTLSEKALTDIFITEMTRGMYVDCNETAPVKQISAKAGIIKVAFENLVFDELDTRRIRAAVNAAQETGATIHCHTGYYSQNAVMCAKEILRMGMSPEKLIIAHTDLISRPPEEFHLKIAEMGVFMDFDGFVNPHPGYDRTLQVGNVISLIKKMLEKGYGKQVLVGDDMLRFGLKGYGGDGMEFNPGVFRRWLMVSGVTPEQVEDIFVNNPARSNAMSKS